MIYITDKEKNDLLVKDNHSPTGVVTDNQNRMQKSSSDGSQKSTPLDKIFSNKLPEGVKLWSNSNLREAYREGKLQRQEEIINLINEDYPDLEIKKSRTEFIRWRDDLIKQIDGEK